MQSCAGKCTLMVSKAEKHNHSLGGGRLQLLLQAERQHAIREDSLHTSHEKYARSTAELPDQIPLRAVFPLLLSAGLSLNYLYPHWMQKMGRTKRKIVANFSIHLCETLERQSSGPLNEITRHNPFRGERSVLFPSHFRTHKPFLPLSTFTAFSCITSDYSIIYLPG